MKMKLKISSAKWRLFFFSAQCVGTLMKPLWKKNPRRVVKFYLTKMSLWNTLKDKGQTDKSPASRLFAQLFIQTQIKENIKAPRHWPLCGEFTGDRWIPRTNGRPVTRKMFPFDDVIMTSYTFLNNWWFKRHSWIIGKYLNNPQRAGT